MTSRFPSVFCVVLLAAALVLPAGCASKYGDQMTKVNYYPQCYKPVQQLREDENTVARSTATGAIGGGLLGALIGGLATGDVKGALAGAAAGAAAGGVAGNIYGKNRQRQNDQQLLAAYNQQLGADAAAMDRQTAAANLAIQCYNHEFDRIVADYKDGKITKQELQDRYSEIRSGLQETSYVLNQRYDSMVRKDAEYQRVLDTEYAQAQPVEIEPAAVPAARRSIPVSSTRQNASHFKGSTQKLRKTRDKAVQSTERQDTTIASLVEQTGHV